MTLLARKAARAELKKLLRGKPHFKVRTSKSQVAAALWDYGEDELAARAIDMTDAELASIENISAWYAGRRDPSDERAAHHAQPRERICSDHPLRRKGAAIGSDPSSSPARSS